MRIILLSLFLSFVTIGSSASAQTQLGDDFAPGGEGGWFGYSVDISDSGRGVLVGEPDFDNDLGTSTAYFYYYTDEGTWDGEFQVNSTTGRAVGSDVAISGSGTFAALGAGGTSSNGSSLVAPYRFRVTGWFRAGEVITSSVADFRLGCSLAMNGDGRVLAVGRCGPPGAVEVYAYENDAWRRRGNRIAEEVTAERVVAISQDGERVVVGLPTVNNGRGEVRVYDYDGSEYRLYGDPIPGREAADAFGASIDLSHDGKHLIVGVPGTGNGRGATVVYEDGGDQWNVLFSRRGEQSQEAMGYAVSISGDGNVFSYSGPGASNGNGGVAVFQLFDERAVIIGSINGRNQEELGRAIALDSTGRRIVVGTPDLPGKPGRAAVFELEVLTAVTSRPQFEDRAVFPNPTSGPVNLLGRPEQISGVRVYDLVGRILLTAPDHSVAVDLAVLPPGSYTVAWKEADIHYRARVIKR